MAEPAPNLPDDDMDPPPPPGLQDPGWKPRERTLVWHKGIAEGVPIPPNLAANAAFFGLDTGTRDVFVHAQSIELDDLQVARAYGMDACLFANPSGRAPADEAFVTIDHIERHHPVTFEDFGLHAIRQRVRATFARDRTK